MTKRLIPLILISLGLAACAGGGAGVVSSTGTVTGLVFNFDANNSPVAGASVRLSSGTPSTTTGADGRYTLSNVPAGVQTLVASTSGFPAVQRQVSVTAQGSVTLNFGLTALGNPGVVGPSSYQGGTLTVNITSQGQSAIFAATIAPHDVDGGTYSLQAVALSYFRTSPTSGAPRVTSMTSSHKADPLSPRLRQLEREWASRLPRRFAVPQPTVQPQVGSQATFWVLTDASTMQQAQTAATLQAESAHGLLYVGNQDLGTITQSRASNLLQAWEAEIFSRVTQVFGPPQNPFDASGQGQVTILYSRTVGQAATGLLGYFFPIDLYPDSDTFPQLGLHSNERDIVYFDPSSPDTSLKGTMAHEFQHLINYSQHVFQFAGPAEVAWINEGLSMAAMDVAGYGFQVGNNSDHVASFMNSPGSVSLWTWQNTLADYGAAWLFFRYAADRFGNQILGRLVQTSLTGAANVESQTGEPIGKALGEEALAILNIAAQIGLSMPYTYTSITASNLGAPLMLTAPGSVTINSGGYQFYGFGTDPSLPAARITIQVGTATPWVSFW